MRNNRKKKHIIFAVINPIERLFEIHGILPISFATSINFDFVLEISTILMPRLANCLAYSRPMPSVEPVTTEVVHEKNKQQHK